MIAPPGYFDKDMTEEEAVEAYKEIGIGEEMARVYFEMLTNKLNGV